MRQLAIVCILVAVVALPAAAQDAPKFDVSGEYSFLRDSELEQSFHGWLLSAAGNMSSVLGIVGEVGGNYKTISVLGTDLELSVHTFMAGVRFSSRANEKVTPFGQIVAGAARAAGSAFGESESATEFALQPGGGVDIWITPTVGIRAGADYRRIFSDPGTNEFRLHFGVVFAGR
jgi:opacity protein-like surface antigen